LFSWIVIQCFTDVVLSIWTVIQYFTDDISIRTSLMLLCLSGL
jgi:hypothetical protein